MFLRLILVVVGFWGGVKQWVGDSPEPRCSFTLICSALQRPSGGMLEAANTEAERPINKRISQSRMSVHRVIGAQEGEGKLL